MTKPAAFKATIEGLKTIRTRKVIVITMEAPIEHLNEITAVFEPGAWVAVARLDPHNGTAAQPASLPSQADDAQGSTTDEHRGGSTMKVLQTAGNRASLLRKIAITCNDARFRRFLVERYRTVFAMSDNDPAQFVRHWCRVESRRDIISSASAMDHWNKLDAEYTVWRDVPELEKV